MTSRQQWLLVTLVVALLGGGVYLASRTLGHELTQVTVGSRAPDFRGAVIVAAPVPAADVPPAQPVPAGAARRATPPYPEVPLPPRSLADYRGEVVLLNIWATWCGPCRVEMPSIQALHEALGPRGLKVVAVSVDNPGKARDIHAFASEMGLTFDILYDSLGTIQSAYRTTGVPETFVLARDGTIRKKWIGPEDWNSGPNRRLVESLLAEKAP